jgi:hypothetical protein
VRVIVHVGIRSLNLILSRENSFIFFVFNGLRNLLCSRYLLC